MKLFQIPGAPNYFVTKSGEVFSQQPIGFGCYYKKKVGRLHGLKPIRDVRYSYVNLCIEGKRAKIGVHALVLLTFRGPRFAGQQTRHLNGKNFDNRLRNLKWGTAKQNADDRERHGRTACGSRSGG